MDDILEKIKDVQSDCCVTILLETHRTPPGNQKDDLVLKNLVKEAEAKLYSECKKDSAKILSDKINQLASRVDYQHNLDGLALFVNKDVAEIDRLPIKVENRVEIGKTFAIKALVRSMHEQLEYYILVLSRVKARLIDAAGDTDIREMDEGFPMENTFSVPGEGELVNGQDSSISAFFIRVDTQLNQLQKDKDLPVFICTDESNYAEYLEVARRKETIAGLVTGNKDFENVNNIIDAVWPVAKKWNDEKNHERLAELSAAVGAKNFLTDFTEIWRAINEGRGRTLFVKKGFFQPAKLENNVVQLVSDENTDEANVDDIINKMIEKNRDFGGDTVFISDDSLNRYSGLVLVTRY